MKKLLCAILAVMMVMLSASALADGAVLKVGTNPEFPPFEYIGDTGEVEGIDADIIEAIGEKLGYTIEWEIMDFDALVPSLVSGKIDASIAGMTITEERKQSVLFSDPYFEATQVVILPAGSEIATIDELAGKKIGVQLGTTGDLMISDEKYGIGEISRYNKGMDAALDLANGRLDAVVIDSLPAAQFVASIDGLEIRYDMLAEAEIENYGIALPMGQDELLAQINTALTEMNEDGTMALILLSYIDFEEEEAEEITEG